VNIVEVTDVRST